MKGFVLTITVAQCFGLASPACAQAAEAISLTDAVRRAKHAVGPVIVSAATHAQAKQEERVARASYLPSLKVEGGLGVGYANQPYVPGLPRYEGSAVIGSSNATVDWVVGL